MHHTQNVWVDNQSLLLRILAKLFVCTPVSELTFPSAIGNSCSPHIVVVSFQNLLSVSNNCNIDDLDEFVKEILIKHRDVLPQRRLGGDFCASLEGSRFSVETYR